MPKVAKNQIYRNQKGDIDFHPGPCNFETSLYLIKEKIGHYDTAFYQVNLCSVVNQFLRWKTLLPRVQPFYAVKCQPDTKIISLLGKLGAGFDCASRDEIKKVIKTLSMNSVTASNKIIYANPFKFKKDIHHAHRAGVSLTTFDTESELIKLATEWPNAKLVLRISPERTYDASCVLGNKFGADPQEVTFLLQRAKDLSMDIVGFSFHVGSGCKEMDAFPETAIYCAKIIDLARDMGFNPYLLDIGGGFPGMSSICNDIDKQTEFEAMCQKLNLVLDRYFPEESNIKLIAEPGRYFVNGAFTLATKIIGKRSLDLLNPSSKTAIVACGNQEMSPESCVPIEYSECVSSCSINYDSSCELYDHHSEHEMDEKFKDSKLKGFRYVINDGVYNSFNCIVFDHAKPVPLGLFDNDGFFRALNNESQFYVSTIYGPTCDGFDCILQEVELPEMEMDNWIVWPNMGAYTSAASSCFNGIQKPITHYFMCEELAERFKNSFVEPTDKTPIDEITESPIFVEAN